MAIMRACLKAGVAYMDMATGQTQTKTIDEAYLEQTTLAGDFAKAGLTALLSTGMDPGVTNTFAANGYEDLDKCFEIRIKDYALFDSPVPLQVWSQETYYTDCAQPPLLFEDGEFKRVEIFGRREHYEFPEPFGLGCVICHDHEEVTTLPRLLPKKFGEKGLRYVDFKMGGPEEGIDADLAFVSSGMTSKYPVTLKDGSQVRPIDVFVATLPPNPPADELAKLALAGEITDTGVVVVDCIGEKNGKPATRRLHHLPPRHQVGERSDPGRHLRVVRHEHAGVDLRRVHRRGQDHRHRHRLPGGARRAACATPSSPSAACATWRSRARTSSRRTEICRLRGGRLRRPPRSPFSSRRACASAPPKCPRRPWARFRAPAWSWDHGSRRTPRSASSSHVLVVQQAPAPKRHRRHRGLRRARPRRPSDSSGCAPTRSQAFPRVLGPLAAHLQAHRRRADGHDAAGALPEHQGELPARPCSTGAIWPSRMKACVSSSRPWRRSLRRPPAGLSRCERQPLVYVPSRPATIRPERRWAHADTTQRCAGAHPP